MDRSSWEVADLLIGVFVIWMTVLYIREVRGSGEKKVGYRIRLIGMLAILALALVWTFSS